MGVKYALYFAFLEHYVTMLSIAAIVGIAVMLYGIITLYSSDNVRF